MSGRDSAPPEVPAGNASTPASPPPPSGQQQQAAAPAGDQQQSASPAQDATEKERERIHEANCRALIAHSDVCYDRWLKIHSENTPNNTTTLAPVDAGEGAFRKCFEFDCYLARNPDPKVGCLKYGNVADQVCKAVVQVTNCRPEMNQHLDFTVHPPACVPNKGAADSPPPQTNKNAGPDNSTITGQPDDKQPKN
jgi:hypothetical protein